jgi:LPXTG-motif cell wall-anchored protein
VIIKDGADALKEFSAPTPLKKSAIVFNAPSNPAATTATDTTTKTPAINTATITKVIETPKEVNTGVAGEELPLTGMNSTILLLIAGFVALILLTLRRKI